MAVQLARRDDRRSHLTPSLGPAPSRVCAARMENSSTTEEGVTRDEMIPHSLSNTQIGKSTVLRNPFARVSSFNHAPFLAQQHILHSKHRGGVFGMMVTAYGWMKPSF